MTVHDNPVKRIVTVRKVDGKLAIGLQGAEHRPVPLKMRSSCAQETPANFSGLRRRNGAAPSVTSIEAA